MEIVTFQVHPPTLIDIAAPAEVTVEWEVRDATAVLISGLGRVEPAGSDTMLVEETTRVVLTAFDAMRGRVESRWSEVEVTPQPAHQQLPAGLIVPWWGREDQVPDGWALCDGSERTPALRGRFVLGAGGAAAPGAHGEAAPHTHGLGPLGEVRTVEGGKHEHVVPEHTENQFDAHDDAWAVGLRELDRRDVNDPWLENGVHSHRLAVRPPGELATEPLGAEPRPPAFALHHIKKV